MKGNKILGAVWILVAIALAGILVSQLVGGKKMFGFINFKNEKSENQATSSEMNFSQNEINEVDVDLTFGSIVLEKADVNDITVSLEGNKKVWPEVYSEGNVLKIKSELQFVILGFNRLTVTVKVPKNYDLKDINLETASGSIKVRGMKTPVIDVHSLSGSVTVENCEGESAELKTASGSIKINSCKFKEIEAKALSGSVSLDGECNAMDLESTSGSVNAVLSSPLTAASSMKSTSGSVHLNVPDNSNLDIKYSVVSGNYKNSLTGTSGKKGTDRIGSGGINLELKTTSGSIKID